MKQIQTSCFWLLTLLLLLVASSNQAHAAFPIRTTQQPAAGTMQHQELLPAAIPELQVQKVSKLERWALKIHTQSKAYQRAAVNGFAIGALAGVGVGLLGFILVEGWILGLGAVAAITLGIIGLSGHRKNRGLAWAALILGSIELLFLIAVLLLIATL